MRSVRNIYIEIKHIKNETYGCFTSLDKKIKENHKF